MLTQYAILISTLVAQPSVDAPPAEVSPPGLQPIEQSLTLDAHRLHGPVRTIRESSAIVATPLDLPARYTRPHVQRILRFDEAGRLAMATSYTFNEVDISHVYAYDERDNLIESLSFTQEDAPPSRAEFTYDRQGRLTRQVYADSDGKRTTHRTEYSTSDDVTTAIMRNREEEVAIAKRLMPDADGRWRVMSFTSTEDQPLLIKVEQFNANGQLLTSVWFDTQQQISGRTLRSYDEYGRLEQRQVLDRDDELIRAELWMYDSQDRPQTHRVQSGNRLVHTSLTYDDDVHGNWVRRTESSMITRTDQPQAEPQHEEVVTYREFEYAPTIDVTQEAVAEGEDQAGLDR